MPPLLPSEVARLVYGQLIRCNCSSIAEGFLNESPHLEECREFVNQVGKPSFIVKAYGLSLQQILQRYLEMWTLSTLLLVLERTNSVLPNTWEKFADPVDALKFLLSAYDQTANKVDNLRTLSDEMRWKTIYENGTWSNFSSRVSPTACMAHAIQYEPSHRLNHLNDTNRFYADATECNGVRAAISEDITGQNYTPSKLKRPNRYLDQLYASTGTFENPGSRKRLKVLKPRQPVFKRSSTTHSAPRKAASNPNLSEDKFRFEDNSSYNAEACVHSEKDSETTVMPRTKSPEFIKRTNMQLRSSNKVSDRITQQASGNENVKVSKKRKCSSSPERESVAMKQSKLCKSSSGKENDTQVDFTKIPQLLIEDPKLPELIAENINKRILGSPKKKIDTLTEDQDNVIKSIAEKTLEDHLMDDIIYELLKCGQNIAQEKHSTVPDISLLDDNPYDANVDGEDSAATHRISENVDVIDNLPLPQCNEKNEQIFANTDYSRLHEDMNEFVQFNKPKDNNVLSSDQSGIIVIEVPETDQYSSNLVIENQISSAHSNFVVCSTSESLVTNGKGLQDDNIITLCTESNGVKWDVPTTSSMIVAAATPTNTNTKLQICGPVTSPTKITKRNYRPIAPKPNSVVSKSNPIVVVRNEMNSHHNKSKSLKRAKK